MIKETIMNKRKNSFCLRRLFPVALASCISLMHYCTSNIAGNSTQTGNPTVVAMLYNPGGSPAVNATVRFCKSGSDPRNDSGYSTVTDAHGNYTATLDTGVYNIIARGDSGMAFRDSIKVIKGDTVKPPPDTLKAPGSIRGVIRLQPGDDARTVFILLMGTNTWTKPDDSTGKFTVANLAEAAYDLRFISSLDNYGVLDTNNIPVRSADTTNLDTIELPFKAPQALNAYVDDSAKSITLTWSAPPGIPFAGYYVYRSYQSISGYDRISNLLEDTVYTDSSFNPSDSGKTIYYRATGVFPNAMESPYSEPLTVYISFKPDSVNDLPTHQ